MTEAPNAAPRFVPDELLAEASRQAGGLKDFGDTAFREPFGVLCDSLEREAKLSALGRTLLHQKFIELLVNRLRVEDWYARHPEIEDETLVAPIVVVGLPRTGTTLLQRVLSADPQFYPMLWWETRYPVPFPGESLQTPSERQTRARAEVKVMVDAMPKLMTIHPMDADQADEEAMLMEHSFIAAFNAYAHVPSYMQWLYSHDETPAYEYLKRMLRFLQWQKRQRGFVGTRWVLKTPHHLLRMDLLLRMFPGARIVQCHRDPVQTIPSIASMIHTLRQIYGAAPDPKVAGAEWCGDLQRGMAHTMKVRETHGAQFFDVDFRDTVKQPLEVVRAIYAFAGLELKPSAEAAIRHWLDSNPREARAAHDYVMSDFGLSEEQLKRDFADYRARYIEGAEVTA